MGQAIAAYVPNEYFAAISNPLFIGCGLISFCGVVVPYTAMQPFWKYWLYYLDPFNYLVGGLFGTVVWDVKISSSMASANGVLPSPNSQNLIHIGHAYAA